MSKLSLLLGALFTAATLAEAQNASPASTSIAPIAPTVATSPSTAESPSAIILGYHQFTPGDQPSKNIYSMTANAFAGEMKYLKDSGCHVVPLSDIVHFIEGKGTLPPHAVAITIDDGYKSPIVNAAPILKQYGYPWTFFCYTDFIASHENKGAASWDDLLELQKEGVDIECHSMTHPLLTHKGGKSPEQYAAWLENETAGAKKILDDRLGKPVTSFAYPYGDWNKQVQAAVIAAGFQSIFTVADNPVHSTTNPYSIGRYTITQSVEKNFAAYLHQSALSLTKADPEPGATISNPQPVITAVLTQMSADALDPASLETQVRDMGIVKHDFDPATNTVRIYLPRPLIQQVEFVNIRVRDAKTGQIMVANWQFNYEPGAGAVLHPPIPTSAPAPAPTPTTTNVTPSTATVEKEAPSPTVGTSPVSAPALPKTD